MIVRRSTKNMRLGGVCAGIAREIGWEPIQTRFAFVSLTLLSAVIPGAIIYFLLWTRVPRTTEW
jgi:phage shock protein C